MFKMEQGTVVGNESYRQNSEANLVLRDVSRSADLLVIDAFICTEAAPVIGRRQANEFFKDFPEGASIFISNLPGNFFHRKLCKFEKLTGFLHFQMLYVFRGRKTS